LLFDFLNDDDEVDLTPEQWAEIDRRFAENDPYATDEEVRAFFARFGK
jgi:hypothetical protein